MAGDLNRITIIGRLTRDPELKYLQSGSAVCNFSIANNHVYMKNNEKKSDASYFDCTAWGKLAETIDEYLKKGSKIAIEGRLQQRRWEDQQGDKHSKIDVVIDSIQFLDQKKEETSGFKMAPEPFSDDIPF